MILQVRNFKHIFLLLLLCGAVGTAFAIDPPYGDNLEYAMDGTTLVLTSPDPTQPATIYSQAFKDCTNITDIVFPDNLTEISSYAFEGCTSLDNVVILPSVTNIGAYAFYGCTALHNVLCRPFTAPTLGTDAFTGCNASLQICVPALGNYRYKTNWTSYYENTVLTDCEFLDESDELSNTEAKINSYRSTSVSSLTLFRTLRKAGCFNTLTLPFNVSNLADSPLGGDNVEVYTFTDAAVENGTLVFDITKVNINRLEAGVPYLIQWNNTGEVITRMDFTDIDGWDGDNTAETTNGTGVTYHGFYGKTHISDDATNGTQHLNLFLGGNNTLYWPTDGDIASAKMLGFRAWFQVSTVASFAPVHRNMPASFRIVSTPTDMDQITNDQLPKTNKIIEDGHLIIIRNGEKYSINGQKL